MSRIDRRSFMQGSVAGAAVLAVGSAADVARGEGGSFDHWKIHAGLYDG